MPIRFRCSNCNRLLGIARRKAGAMVACPHCQLSVRVPEPGPEDNEDDEILPSRKVSPAPPPAFPAEVTPPPIPRPVPAAKTVLPPRPPTSPERPPASPERPPASPPPPARRPSIFEQSNIEEILRSEPDLPVLIPQAGVSGVQPVLPGAIPENVLVLSSSRATILSVLLALLLAIVFAGGVLVGRLIR